MEPQHDKEPAVSGEQARRVIEIIELGYRAAETGQTQDMTTTFALRELAVNLGWESPVVGPYHVGRL